MKALPHAHVNTWDKKIKTTIHSNKSNHTSCKISEHKPTNPAKWLLYLRWEKWMRNSMNVGQQETQRCYREGFRSLYKILQS